MDLLKKTKKSLHLGFGKGKHKKAAQKAMNRSNHGVSTEFVINSVQNSVQASGNFVSGAFKAGAGTVQAVDQLVFGAPPKRTCNKKIHRSSSRGSFHTGGAAGIVVPFMNDITHGLEELTGFVGGGATTNNNRRDSGSSILRKHSDEPVVVYCSDMYSHEHILKSIDAVEDDPSITSLSFEDSIVRQDKDITKALVHMLVSQWKITDDNNASTMSLIKEDAERGSNLRSWETITFVDCISSSDDYKEYAAAKKTFMFELRRRLAMKGIAMDLPVRFHAKLDLFSSMTAFDVLQLFQAVQQDINIKAVTFPESLGRGIKQVPNAFAAAIDEETMELNKTMEIVLKYRKNYLVDQDKTKVAATKKALAVMEQCCVSLQSRAFESMDLSDSESEMSKDDVMEKPAPVVVKKKTNKKKPSRIEGGIGHYMEVPATTTSRKARKRNSIKLMNDQSLTSSTNTTPLYMSDSEEEEEEVVGAHRIAVEC